MHPQGKSEPQRKRKSSHLERAELIRRREEVVEGAGDLPFSSFSSLSIDGHWLFAYLIVLQNGPPWFKSIANTASKWIRCDVGQKVLLQLFISQKADGQRKRRREEEKGGGDGTNWRMK